MSVYYLSYMVDMSYSKTTASYPVWPNNGNSKCQRLGYILYGKNHVYTWDSGPD